MERKNFINKLDFYKGLAIIYFVGLIGHLITPVREYMFVLTPYVLLLSGIIILSEPILSKNWKLLSWVFICGIVTFMIEAVGVATKKIFGPYSYGNVLGIKILEVPVIISFNWIIVIYGTTNFSKLLFKNKYITWILPSCLTVIFDFILEPVAIKFNYWKWETETIPIQNYIAWLLISFVMTGAFHFMKLDNDKKLPSFYFVILFIYFLLLRILL